MNNNGMGNLNPMQLVAQIHQLQQQIQSLMQYVGHIEQNSVALSIESNAHKLHLKLLENIIVEHNLILEEDMKKLYEENVEAPIKEQIEKVNAEFQRQAGVVEEELKKNNELKNEDVVEESQKEEETESKIILASERFQQSKDGE